MKLIADLEALREKATPGEWRPHRHQDVIAPHGEVLARCYLQHPDGEIEREANQHLIAAMHNALPAILTALRAAEDVYPFVADKGCIAIELPDRRFINREQAVEAFRLALAALGEGPRSGGDSCPREGCTHLPDGGPVAKDGVYRGARFCLCHQFETGPYARSEGPREGL